MSSTFVKVTLAIFICGILSGIIVAIVGNAFLGVIIAIIFFLCFLAALDMIEVEDDPDEDDYYY
jgi:hypothetical protein